MGEYDRNQQKPVSRAVANNGGGSSRQLKEIVDNRNSIILPYNSHSSIQCCCIDVIQRVTPLEAYLQSLEDIENVSISDNMAMIGQDNVDKDNVIHDSLKRMVEQYYADHGELPYTLAGMLNGEDWSGEKNKEFLDSLDRQTVQIATPYFLGYAYNLYGKEPRERITQKQKYSGQDQIDFESGLNNYTSYSFNDNSTSIKHGTAEEIAYLKYKHYTLEGNELIPPAAVEVEEEEYSDSFKGFDLERMSQLGKQ